MMKSQVTRYKNSLGSKQRELFSVVHEWVKGYVKYSKHNVEPVNIFF